MISGESHIIRICERAGVSDARKDVWKWMSSNDMFLRIWHITAEEDMGVGSCCILQQIVQ